MAQEKPREKAGLHEGDGFKEKRPPKPGWTREDRGYDAAGK